MFSQTTEYALRVIVFLAAQGGRPSVIPEIAAGTKTPQGYLAKVLRNLAKADLVRSQRGLHGGSVLARPAEQITIWDVTQAVDPIRRINACPLGLKGHVTLCPVHRRIDEAIALVENAFRNSTIAELVNTPAASRPLCDESVAGAQARAFAVEVPAKLTVRASGKKKKRRK